MFKFIILCAVMACCMARSLNDAGKPAVVEESPTLNSETSALAKSKDVAADDIVEESDSAAAIDSNSGDMVDSDKIRGLFSRFTTTTAATTTTTPLPMMQKIDLLLTLNSMATAGA